MKPWRVFALALVAYGLALLIELPASVALRQMGPELAALVRDARGSLWRGRGQFYVANTHVGPVEWQTTPLGLLSGCVDAQFRLAVHGGASIQWCRGGWSVKDLVLRLDVAAVLPILQLPATSARGVLDVDFESAASNPSGISARGRVLWREASAGLGQSVRLGDVVIRVVPERQHVRADVQNEAGDLELDLTVLLDRQMNYSLTGKLRAAPGSPTIQGLEVLGEREPDGAIGVRYSGSAAL